MSKPKKLSRDQTSLLQRGYDVIPIIARKSIRGDSSSLEGYLLEKLIHIVTNRLDTTKPYFMQWKYISRSLNGHAKNYFRDQSRPIKLPRPIHDRYHEIQAYKKKYALLDPSKDEICTALGIGTLEYEEALNEYNFQLMPIDAFNGNVGIDLDTNEYPEEISLLSCISKEDRDHIDNKRWNKISDDGRTTLEMLGKSFD